MADFTNDFWNLYVAGLVTFGLLLCIVLLLLNMTTRESGEPQVKGHVWDETLREYNNPLPSWWLILFWGTIIFAVVYLVFLPGFGTKNQEKGLRTEYADDVKKAEDLFSKYAKADVSALAQDKEAMATGQRLFLTYCTQCHAASGKGAGRGFPNLTDNDWLYGGDPETIKASIADGRAGIMTPLGGVLNEQERRQVANYVLSLSGNPKADASLVAAGKEIFLGKGTCTTCHGANGTGMKETGWPGAPNLTDNVWLYGDNVETIMAGIEKGRNAGEGTLTNTMPAWKDFLGEGKVNLLAAYVSTLSQGK